MKILHINCLADTFSTGLVIKDLFECADNVGFESFVAYSRGESSLKNSFCYSNTLERKLHALFSRITGCQGNFSYSGTKKLIKYINSVKPNVIHLHNLHDNNVNLPMLINHLAKLNVKVVVTLHDCWFFTGHCCHYINNNCFNWKTGCQKCNFISEDIKCYFFAPTKILYNQKKNLFSKIKKLYVVGVSEWITNQAKQSFFKDIAKFYTIYNKIDIITYRKQSKDLTVIPENINSKKILLSVASVWTKAKGLYDFIELSKILSDEFIIILVGDLTKEVKLPNKIINIPLVTDKKILAQIYNCADLYLNLSYAETFGLATAQAISCQIPVLSYDNTASTELIENYGLLVQTGDILQVSQLIQNSINNKQNVTFYDKNDFFCDYIKIYEN